MATHSSILTWRIPWTEEPSGRQSMGITKSQTRLRDEPSLFILIRGSSPILSLLLHVPRDPNFLSLFFFTTCYFHCLFFHSYHLFAKHPSSTLPSDLTHSSVLLTFLFLSVTLPPDPSCPHIQSRWDALRCLPPETALMK